jgi:uncharacterized membrane protein YraQ (UPF0718 family)/copper chaperone CopZ
MGNTAIQFAADFWSVLGEMSPYLLLGFAAAGVLSVFISPRTVERHLGGEGWLASLKASAFGVPLPLCSCGVIPVSASLRRHGAGKGPTTAFLISTPQTGVDSILVTYSLLGGVFAVFRPLVALVSGLIGGALVSWVTRRDARNGEETCCGHGQGHAENHAHDETCSADDQDCDGEDHGDHEAGGFFSRVMHAAKYGFFDLPQDIGKALLVGLVISAAITTFVPEDFFAPFLGGGILAMLVMMAVGIPMYVCATASVPVAASLIARGVSPGAALVFLMTGPATNAATIATIWRVMGRKTALVYVLTVAVCALLAGLGLDAFYASAHVAHGGHHMGMTPAWLRHGSAIVLLALLAVSTFWPILRPHRPHRYEYEDTLRLSIRGMTCNHCVSSIQRALRELPNVRLAEVDLRAGRAEVVGTDLQAAQLVEAVKKLGYSAEPDDRPA